MDTRDLHQIQVTIENKIRELKDRKRDELIDLANHTNDTKLLRSQFDNALVVNREGQISDHQLAEVTKTITNKLKTID